jgi:hypothetical protein
MNAPHRHDLDTTFCISNKIKVFNRKLLKKMKMYDYAKVMETNLSIAQFIQHKLHMNRLGKELISKTISRNSLKWKEDSMDLSPVDNMLGMKSEDKLEQKGTKARTSCRCRKYPITTVNRSVKERDLIINDRKAHCP